MLSAAEIEAMGALGLALDDDEIDEDELDDDEELLAEYATLEDPAQPDDVEDRIKSLKEEAVRLKRKGDTTGALSKMREARALELEMPAMEALSEVALPSAVKEEEEISFDLAAATKAKAVALKRSGDVQGAIALLRKAKVLESGTAQLEKVEQIRYQKEWKEFRHAAEASLADCVRDGRASLKKGDRQSAEAATLRGKELKSMLQSMTDDSRPPPEWRTADVTESRRFVDETLREGELLVEMSNLKCTTHHHEDLPTRYRLKARLAQVDGVAIETETEALEFPPFDRLKTTLRIDLGSKIIQESRLCKKEDGPANAKRAIARLGRAKLHVELWACGAAGKVVANVFARRERLTFKARVSIEALLDDASHSEHIKLRKDSDYPHPGLRNAQLDLRLALREPLREHKYAEVIVRHDIEIIGLLPPPPPTAVSDDKGEATKTPLPPEPERANPHAPTLLMSDKVLDFELSLVTNTSDLASNARRLAIDTAKQLLQAEVDSGKLSPNAYAERVKLRLQADKILALWLGREANRKQDAARVMKRIKLAQDELEELKDYL